MGSFPSVGCHVGYYQPPINVVVPDFHHAMVRAWREAVAAGYRRIGVAMLKELAAVDVFDKVSAALFCQLRLNPDLEQIPLQHFPLEDRTEFRCENEESSSFMSCLAGCGRIAGACPKTSPFSASTSRRNTWPGKTVRRWPA